MDPPHSPIRGLYVLAASHLHLTHWYTVRGDRMWTRTHADAAHAAHRHAARAAYAARGKSVVGQREHLLLFVAPLSARPREELCLFSVLEHMEIRHAAPQPDLLRRRVHEIDRYKMTRASPMPWLDDEMGQRAGDGINDHASQIPADAVATRDFVSDDELRGLGHEGCLSSLCSSNDLLEHAISYDCWRAHQSFRIDGRGGSEGHHEPST